MLLIQEVFGRKERRDIFSKEGEKSTTTKWVAAFWAPVTHRRVSEYLWSVLCKYIFKGR